MISSCIWNYNLLVYEAAVYDEEKENSIEFFFSQETEDTLADHGIDLRNFFTAYAENRLKSMTEPNGFYEANLTVKEELNNHGLREISYSWSIKQI